MQSYIPDFLIELLKNQYGQELTNKIIDGYNKKRYLTFRVNTLKSNNEEIEEVLNKNNIQYQKSNIINEAYILDNLDKLNIEKLDIYNEGKIYMQSLSSMLPPIILDPKPSFDILDMTAAPGGKTTQIAAITKNQAHITACELNKIRAQKLKYNIEKQGASCVYCMVQDAKNIDDFFSFDQILLDAPCSGSGTLNSLDNNITKYFTKELIEKSVKAQTSLLKKAVKLLKSGSQMIYSTCSILQLENEDVVNSILKNNNIEVVPIEDEFIKNIPLLPTKINGTICVCPNELYEGFYVAKLRKK